MGEVIGFLWAWGVVGFLTFVTCFFVAQVIHFQLEGRWIPSPIPIPKRKPKHITAAIEELTAHKMLHNSWMEGQKLAMAWWEQQCNCPSVKDYRQIPGCKRIAQGTGVCVEWEGQALDTLVTRDMDAWREKMNAYGQFYYDAGRTKGPVPPHMNPDTVYEAYLRNIR